MEAVVLSWSGGKDAALALRELRRDTRFEVVELLTTVNEDRGRSTMHGVRRELHDRQAAALGLPVRYVEIPDAAGNDAYEERMADAMAACERRGIDRIAFADLLLEDVRAYREVRLADTGLTGIWPIWGRDTGAVAEELLERGFRATLVCVDGDALDPSFLGREFSVEFLDDLPEAVDPCGENGEFHTFVHDGSVFEKPVEVEVGERIDRERNGGTFHYCDLVPG